MKLGYFLSSEEYAPRELVRQAVLAQEAGFDRLWISDHLHPWNDEQGHSGISCGRRSPRSRWPHRGCGSPRR